MGCLLGPSTSRVHRSEDKGIYFVFDYLVFHAFKN